MRLIDTYVAAVGERLHGSRRGAVEAELRANILDALEAHGGSLDSENDIVGVLEQLGSPERVAAEYEPQRGFLVGPELFPYLRRAGAIALGAILAGGALFYGTGLLFGGLAEFRAGTLLAQTLGVVIRALIAGTVVLVGVFTWLQRSAVRLPPAAEDTPWDPRTLAERPPSHRASRFESAVTLVASAVVLLLLDGVGSAARAVASQAAPAVQPLASDVVVAVLALQVALLLAFVAHVAVVVKGRWFALTRLLRFLADGIAIVVFVRAPFRLIEYRSALREAGASDNVVNWLVANAFVAGAIALIVAALYGVRQWRAERSGTDPLAPGSGSTLQSLAMALLALMIAGGCAAAPGNRSVAEGPASAAPSSGIVSPEVHADGSITFRLHAPDASQVNLVVESNEGVGMARAADGVWSYTTGPLMSDLHSYHFAVDGRPVYDRLNPRGAPLVTGGRHSFVHIPGPASLPWEKRDVPAGRLGRHEYASDRFGETRDVWVYTPHGYAADADRRYPVLVLLHGVLNDAQAWSTVGRVDVIMDNLMAAGGAQPMIVVMPLGYGISDARRRAPEMLAPSTDQWSVMNEFAAGLIEEVLPLVDREYRTRTDREGRAIAGFSMGGSQALAIGLNHPDAFGEVAAIAGAFIMFGSRYEHWFPGLTETRPPQRVSFSVGGDDFLLPVNRHLAGWLAERGVLVDFQVVSGGHSMQVGRRELVRLVPTLFR
jgi:enterochelin esterase-like enzyme